MTTPPVKDSADEPDIPVEADSAAEEVVAVVLDGPYIETSLCTTCDQCTDKNDRMIAYGEDKQAYIKDIEASS